ncbi:hypothetical protein FK545_20725 (plasmid) [Planococcus glaciei]|nr:hypothetical protein [Planococcus glaciei]QDY47008.1 hypothetical protein FK545_20725 [Planococcus glaciei]
MNGGGVNTWKSLRYYSENKKISLTITDSDKRYPTGNVGETLRKLRTEYNKHKNNTITDLVELKVREKENLIPPSVYLYCCNSSDKSRLENFMLLEDSNKHSEKLFYLDYKEGLNVKSYKRDSQLQGYIEEMVKDFPHLATCSLEDIDSLSDDYRIIEGISMNVSDYFSVGVFYEGLEKELEDKLMIEKIPAEVIDDLRNSIDKKNKMFRHMPESFQVHLEEICKKLIDWGCANSSFIAT